MKKLLYLSLFLSTMLCFNGCDYIDAPINHYVSIYNNESDKYITSVYYRDYYSYNERWSNNIINSFIYPYDYLDLVFEEGTYDFWVIMEDDYYSYTIYIYSVNIYEDLNLEVCLDCYDKSTKIEVKRTPKGK